MGKIVCLMGKSSTGKDTVFKELLKDEELDLKQIISYTTRPIRAGETEGVEYYYTNEEGFQTFIQEGKVIEHRKYETFHGLWRYFTVHDEQIQLEKENYCLIGTLEAYGQLCTFFGYERIIPILIDLDDGIRLQRALNRERKQRVPKYQELCRRFLADSEDFSEEKINKLNIQNRYYNDDFSKCYREIKACILEMNQLKSDYL